MKVRGENEGKFESEGKMEKWGKNKDKIGINRNGGEKSNNKITCGQNGNFLIYLIF